MIFSQRVSPSASLIIHFKEKMSLQVWTAQFYLLVHEYNRHARDARQCRDGQDLGDIRSFYGISSFNLS